MDTRILGRRSPVGRRSSSPGNARCNSCDAHNHCRCPHSCSCFPMKQVVVNMESNDTCCHPTGCNHNSTYDDLKNSLIANITDFVHLLQVSSPHAANGVPRHAAHNFGNMIRKLHRILEVLGEEGSSIRYTGPTHFVSTPQSDRGSVRFQTPHSTTTSIGSRLVPEEDHLNRNRYKLPNNATASARRWPNPVGRSPATLRSRRKSDSRVPYSYMYNQTNNIQLSPQIVGEELILDRPHTGIDAATEHQLSQINGSRAQLLSSTGRFQPLELHQSDTSAVSPSNPQHEAGQIPERLLYRGIGEDEYPCDCIGPCTNVFHYRIPDSTMSGRRISLASDHSRYTRRKGLTPPRPMFGTPFWPLGCMGPLRRKYPECSPIVAERRRAVNITMENQSNSLQLSPQSIREESTLDRSRIEAAVENQSTSLLNRNRASHLSSADVSFQPLVAYESGLTDGPVFVEGAETPPSPQSHAARPLLDRLLAPGSDQAKYPCDCIGPCNNVLHYPIPDSTMSGRRISLASDHSRYTPRKGSRPPRPMFCTPFWPLGYMGPLRRRFPTCSPIVAERRCIVNIPMESNSLQLSPQSIREESTLDRSRIEAAVENQSTSHMSRNRASRLSSAGGSFQPLVAYESGLTDGPVFVEGAETPPSPQYHAARPLLDRLLAWGSDQAKYPCDCIGPCNNVLHYPIPDSTMSGHRWTFLREESRFTPTAGRRPDMPMYSTPFVPLSYMGEIPNRLHNVSPIAVEPLRRNFVSPRRLEDNQRRFLALPRRTSPDENSRFSTAYSSRQENYPASRLSSAGGSFQPMVAYESGLTDGPVFVEGAETPLSPQSHAARPLLDRLLAWRSDQA